MCFCCGAAQGTQSMELSNWLEGSQGNFAGEKMINQERGETLYLLHVAARTVLNAEDSK